MKYLKYFETEAEYTQFKNTEAFVLPNVSYVEDIKGIMFNPDAVPASPNLVCVYDIVDTSRETQIAGDYTGSYFTSMIVDGVEMDFDKYYQFDTVGLHTVEFVLDEQYRTELPNSSLFGVNSVISISIPDSVTYIENYTFSGCSGLTEFKCKFASEDNRCLIIDGTLVAFARAELTEYTIPDSVTTIGSSAFSWCSSLTSITIPDSVTSIQYAAFTGCSSLTSINIPDSVTSIGSNAFSGCSSLTSVYCKAVTPPTIAYYTFDNNASDRKIYVPMESVDAYKAASYWSEYADAIVGYNF